MRMNRATAPGTVYRVYDDVGGTLLYIGCTNDVRSRLTAHAKKDWWPTNPHVVTTDYDNYRVAFAAEQDEIRTTGGGLHNVTQAETSRRAWATIRRQQQEAHDQGRRCRYLNCDCSKAVAS